jgi:16S rRNA (guanine1207-N2)-methyltransferase
VSAPRLTLALEDGALPLPAEGRVAVLHPGETTDLSALPAARVQVIEPRQPAHDLRARHGLDVTTELDGPYAAALVVLPRAKALARDLVAAADAAVAPGGPVIVDGQKTDGVESILRDLRRRVSVSAPVSKAHGKLFWFPAEGTLGDWRRPARQTTPEGFVTAPGVFSADGPDPGSVLLAGALPAKLPTHMADLGAGWGYLATRVLAHDRVARLDLVEADRTALDCARENVTDPRARFHWGDARAWRPETAPGGVVMNPPFHEGRAPDPDLGRAFVAAAAEILAPGGRLWLVANRHLPYEAELARRFRTAQEIAGDARFKVLEAARPTRPGR